MSVVVCWMHLLVAISSIANLYSNFEAVETNQHNMSGQSSNMLDLQTNCQLKLPCVQTNWNGASKKEA